MVFCAHSCVISVLLIWDQFSNLSRLFWNLLLLPSPPHRPHGCNSSQLTGAHKCYPNFSAISLTLWSLLSPVLWSGKLLNCLGLGAEPFLQQIQLLTFWDSVTVSYTPACSRISHTTGFWWFMRQFCSTPEATGYCWAMVSSAGPLGATLLSAKDWENKLWSTAVRNWIEKIIQREVSGRKMHRRIRETFLYMAS